MSEALQPYAEGSRNGNYNYHELIEELDKMNRELKEMKESVLKRSVRAHILEADLASLVNPDMAESLRKVQEDCQSCSLAMKLESLQNTQECEQNLGE